MLGDLLTRTIFWYCVGLLLDTNTQTGALWVERAFRLLLLLLLPRHQLQRGGWKDPVNKFWPEELALHCCILHFLNGYFVSPKCRSGQSSLHWTGYIRLLSLCLGVGLNCTKILCLLKILPSFSESPTVASFIGHVYSVSSGFFRGSVEMKICKDKVTGKYVFIHCDV